MHRQTLLGFGLLLTATPALAADLWTKPYPGIMRREISDSNQYINVAYIDTCAAGIRFRATAPAESSSLTSSFGNLVGAQLAVNGDWIVAPGREEGTVALGNGIQWPGRVDHPHKGLLAFGSGRFELREDAEVLAAPEPWMREVVGGRWTLVWRGVVPQDLDERDPATSPAAPRTASGISQDGRTLILAVVDGRRASARGMTFSGLAAFMKDIGSYNAMTHDGGGSSAFWMANQGVVNSPSDATGERVVQNHLAVYAPGQGAADSCVNKPVSGKLESAACEGISGFAQDPDEPQKAANVQISFDEPSPEKSFFVRAMMSRADLCAALGSCEHAFRSTLPFGVLDGRTHSVRAYGIDTKHDNNPHGHPLSLPRPELGQRFALCKTPRLKGVLRSFPSGIKPWGISPNGLDVLRTTNAVMGALKPSRSLPERPNLVVADNGDQRVWLLDGDTKRHVVHEASFARWHFATGTIAKRPAAEVAAIREAEAWPAIPMILQSEGEPFMLDGPVPDGLDPGKAPTGVDAVGVPGLDATDPNVDSSSGESGCAISAREGDTDVTIGGMWFALLIACRIAVRKRSEPRLQK